MLTPGRRPGRPSRAPTAILPDLAEDQGPGNCARARRRCAAGGAHNLPMVGLPGAGKVHAGAAGWPSISPPLSPRELLDVVDDRLDRGRGRRRARWSSPRAPLPRAASLRSSMAAMVGGGIRSGRARSRLAHNGVLFLDELPECRAASHRSAAPAARDRRDRNRPGQHTASPIRRASSSIAAMNPCRSGMAGEPGASCPRGPVAAPPTTRRGCPVRSSTAWTFGSRCRR